MNQRFAILALARLSGLFCLGTRAGAMVLSARNSQFARCNSLLQQQAMPQSIEDE